MAEMKVTRRRLTFADRLKEKDEQIARAAAELEKRRAERMALVAAEKERVAALQSELEKATG